eukprot:7351950-Lingulodinium_polyedra.AAC.1
MSFLCLSLSSVLKQSCSFFSSSASFLACFISFLSLSSMSSCTESISKSCSKAVHWFLFSLTLQMSMASSSVQLVTSMTKDIKVEQRVAPLAHGCPSEPSILTRVSLGMLQKACRAATCRSGDAGPASTRS